MCTDTERTPDVTGRKRCFARPALALVPVWKTRLIAACRFETIGPMLLHLSNVEQSPIYLATRSSRLALEDELLAQIAEDLGASLSAVDVELGPNVLMKLFLSVHPKEAKLQHENHRMGSRTYRQPLSHKTT